ncbi:MAG: protein kinase [Acidobacteriota bacterium]
MAEPTDPTPSTSTRFTLSLGQRIFLLTAALVVLAVGVSVAVTRIIGSSIASKAVSEALERSAAVQSNLGETRLDQIYLQALTISTDPNFVAYVSEAIQEADSGSLFDQLDERQRDLGFDFAIVLDGEGATVARTDLRNSDEDLTESPPFRAALAEDGDYTSVGLWLDEGNLYYSVMVPLVIPGGLLEGYFIAAYVLDDAEALSLRQVTNTEVTFFVTGTEGLTAAASTLDPQAIEQLIERLESTPDIGSEDQGPQEVTLGRDRFLLLSRPVSDVEGTEIGRLVNLGSLDKQLEPYTRIGQVLLGVGLVTVLLSLLASFLLPRRILAPINQLVRVADAASAGHLDVHIAGKSRGDEVGKLARAFSTLLSELREQRDMQVYLTELTRSLPDQEKTVDAVVPPQALRVTILGVDLQGYGSLLNPQNPRDSLELMNQDLRRMSRMVMGLGGRIESAFGHRLLVLFAEEKHESRALTAAAQLITSSKVRVLVSMVTGEMLTGTLNWQNRSVLATAGSLLDELEYLMRVSRPDTLLLSTRAYGAVSDLLRQIGIAAQAHRTNWSEEPIYTLSRDSMGRLSLPDAGTTMALTASGSTSTLQTGGGGRTTLAGIASGSVLGDRFEILSELGAGGMGVVYKARDRELNELVALKMLKHEAFTDSSGLDRLKEELKLARKISHPNVLRTFDFGEADGFPFISMEFVRGVTLKHLLEQSDRLPLSAGLHMARQLCRGLKAAHGQSVIHRDIKPENMIIEPTGNVKLMDFGIAQTVRRRRGDETSDAPIVGTPHYLAPEQLEGLEPDMRADIYSSGVVFFEIFCGKLPYPTGGSVMKIIGRKLNEEPQKPSEAWPEIPAELERIIEKCLARNREERYAGVEKLLQDLEHLRA